MSCFLCIQGGFTSQNGFYMLRGTTPLFNMAKALQGIKGFAVLLFGPFLVPTVPFEECFFRDYANEIKHAVQNYTFRYGNNQSKKLKNEVPLCLVGGVISHSAMEGAIHDGFAVYIL